MWCVTFPRGNLARNSGVLFVSPMMNSGGSLTTRTDAPLYWAAINALAARKLSGYVYNVCRTGEQIHQTAYEHQKYSINIITEDITTQSKIDSTHNRDWNLIAKADANGYIAHLPQPSLMLDLVLLTTISTCTNHTPCMPPRTYVRTCT